MTTGSGIENMPAVGKKASGRYKYVRQEKAGGATFTPNGLAGFVARQIAANINKPKDSPLRVIDPAVGEGVLLVRLLRELVSQGFRRIELHGFDTNSESLRIAKAALEEEFPFVAIRFRTADFLEFASESASKGRSLFAAGSPDRFDVAIANPPYVRTQIIGAAHAQRLASHFGLSGRVDLYYAFMLGMIEVLDDTGVAGIIVSNRFMTTKSGAAVRKVLRESVCVKHVWDLGDTKLFDAAILPAVLLIEKGRGRSGEKPGFTSIYETEGGANAEAPDAIAALDGSGTVATGDGRRFRVVHGALDIRCRLDDVWRVATDDGDAWLGTVASHTSRTFGDIGSIRVGIKTCADDVFIRREWGSMPEYERPELVQPLITHHIGRKFRADCTKGLRWVLYPHVMENGHRLAADLSRYPRTASYLERHRSILESRSYVVEAGRRWYEVWVPQNPGIWRLPKLVFRDICNTPTFWIDLEGCVVNGDCYWLALNSGQDADLLWLAAAVGNSSFIEAFYDHRFHNKLYAGRRRFMTQYVERFPLPDPSRRESLKMVSLAKRIYDLAPSGAAELEAELDSLVWEAFGCQSKKPAGNGI